MDKGKKPALLVAVLLVVAMLVCLAGCGGAAQGKDEGKGTLRIGVRDDIINFSVLNEQTGKYYGLEVDIANEMASRMGYGNVEFSTVTPDDRKEKLLNGEIDCIVACYSKAETRYKNFDFSPTYYRDHPVIMVENSSLITDVSQLMGGVIGTMSGANTAPVLATCLYEQGYIGPNVISNSDEGTQYEGVYVKKIPSYAELSRALEEGVVDAIAMDGSFVPTYINADRSLLDFEITEQEYGVATNKDSELSQPVADAIQSMLDDGTIAAYVDKWN